MGRPAELAVVAALDVVIGVLFLPALFGAPGGFTTSPQVSASVETCNSSSNSCTVKLQNSGQVDGKAVGCDLTYNSYSVQGNVSGAATVNIQAGGGAIGVCSAQAPVSVNPLNGTRVTGHFLLNNGATVPFDGVWS